MQYRLVRFFSRNIKKIGGEAGRPQIKQIHKADPKALDIIFGTPTKGIVESKKQSEFLKKQVIEEQEKLINKNLRNKEENMVIDDIVMKSEYSPEKLEKIILKLNSLSRVLSFFIKNKFYLSETHILLIIKKVSKLYHKNSDSTASSPQKRFYGKQLGDLVNQIELSFFSYKPRNRLQILLYLIRINKYEFKEFVHQRMIFIKQEDIEEVFTLKELMLLVWLCASVKYDKKEFLGLIDQTIQKRFSTIVFDGVKEEGKDNLHHYDFYALPLSLMFWGFFKLDYKTELSKQVSLALTEHNLFAKTDFQVINNYLLGLGSLNKKNKVKFLDCLSERITEKSLVEFNTLTEDTQINIIKSLTKEHGLSEKMTQPTKALCQVFIKNRQKPSPKNLSLLLWHIAVCEHELDQYSQNQVYKLLSNTVSKMNSHNAVLSLYSLFTMVKKENLKDKELAKKRYLIDLLITRIKFQIRSIDKRQLSFLEEIVTSDIKEFAKLGELIK